MDRAVDPSMAFLHAFSQAYIRTRHNNLRCFPSCARLHRESSFCGRSVEIKVIKSLASNPRNALVFGSFSRQSDPPAYAAGENVTKEQVLAGGKNGTAEFFIAEYINANERYYRFVFAPDKKWRYDARVARLDEHTFKVYVAIDDKLCDTLESPPFEIVPVWKSEDTIPAERVDRAGGDQHSAGESASHSGRDTDKGQGADRNSGERKKDRNPRLDATDEEESDGSSGASGEEEGDTSDEDDPAAVATTSSLVGAFGSNARRGTGNGVTQAQVRNTHGYISHMPGRGPPAMPSLKRGGTTDDSAALPVFTHPVHIMSHPMGAVPMQGHSLLGAYGMYSMTQPSFIGAGGMIPGAALHPRPGFIDQSNLIMAPMSFVTAPMQFTMAPRANISGLPLMPFVPSMYDPSTVPNHLFAMNQFPAVASKSASPLQPGEPARDEDANQVQANDSGKGTKRMKSRS